MPYAQFDRRRLDIRPLAQRRNKVRIESAKITPETVPGELSSAALAVVEETATRVRQARAGGRPVMLTFGAHAIKNCLAPVFIALVRTGWVTHLATNGAGIIHDWEFAFQGESSEDVAENVREGQFGIWQETGFYINLAILVGAFEGCGYGESVGRLIQQEGLNIPPESELIAAAAAAAADPERAAAAADLLGRVREFDLAPGWRSTPHPFKRFSVQAAAWEAGVPFTGHPMIGHDIIYNHPMNHGGAIGRTALRDFLTFAEAVSRLDGGVYLSVGSAVMSPMVFEKSLAMARNLARQEGRRLDRHFIAVVDLAESRWDWSRGEPPAELPDYYLRYNKTFSRMGGEMRYATADNRAFLLALLQALTSPA